MKYYCKFCGCIVDVTETTNNEKCQKEMFIECPVCAPDPGMELIPEHETPAQYKNRTGKLWPSHSPVWIKRNDKKEFTGGGFWGVCRYKTAKDMGDKIIVCVQGKNPPPDDWEPEQ